MENNADAVEEREIEYFKFWNVLSHFNIWTCAMSVSLSLMCLTFKEPILAIKLASYDLNVTTIGIIFSIDTITYTLTSVCLNFLPEFENGVIYARLQYIGLLVFVACMVLQGPSPFLPQ